MTAFFAAVLVAALQVGTIQVFVDPGFEIFLDSKPMGTSAGRGLQISDVAPGEHIISVKTPWGTSLSQKVNVLEGEILAVPIAALGLRTRPRGDESTVVVQPFKTTAATCELAMGAARVTGKPAELQLDHVPSGPVRATLRCGSKTAAMDLTLAPGRLLTLQADLPSGKLKVVGDESRITQMKVRTAEDIIMAMSLPMTWKKVIIASLTPGVSISSITQQGDRAVTISVTASGYSSAYAFYRKLDDHPDVQDVSQVSSRYLRAGDGYELTFRTIFRNRAE